MIIGISGKTGTGKSHLAKFLKRRLKFKYIDADKVQYTFYTEPKIVADMVKMFGAKVLHRNGSIDRKKILEVAGKDLVRLGVFYEYFNDLVGKRVKELIEEDEGNYIVESTNPVKQGISKLFDLSILVVSSPRIGYSRLLPKYPKPIVDNIWKYQKDIKNPDFVIENDRTIRELKQDVEELVAEMFKPQQ